MRSALRASAHDRSAKRQDPSLQLLRSSSPLTGPQVSGCSEPGYVLLCIRGPFRSALPGSPSLVCREKNGPGAWRSSSPRRRVVVCQMNLRDARIALSLHGSRWHAFCWRSVVIPAVRIRGSSSVSRAIGLLRALANTDPVPRASDYGDLIKGALECQPMPIRPPRPGGIGVPPSHSSGVKVVAFVRAAPSIETRNSMVAGSAHTAGAALCLGVSPLRRDQVELLLCLVQAEADALR